MNAKRLAIACLLACACDASDAFHEPDPTLARMQVQPRATAFGDGELRPPPAGVVAFGASESAITFTRASLERGRVVFSRTCAACHGIAGDGASVAATKMTERPPPPLDDPRLLSLTPDDVRSILTTGYGLMPPIAAQIDPSDLAPVVAYAEVLRRSRAVPLAALPDDVKRAALAGLGGAK